jgi:HlyD family secretion protein
MTAAVRIVTAERDDVLRVPNAALRFVPRGARAADAQKSSRPATEPPGGERHAVYLLKDGRPARVAVQIGVDDDSFTEITSGNVAVGDTVVVGVRSAPGTAGAAPPGGTTPRIPRL